MSISKNRQKIVQVVTTWGVEEPSSFVDFMALIWCKTEGGFHEFTLVDEEEGTAQSCKVNIKAIAAKTGLKKREVKKTLWAIGERLEKFGGGSPQ